MGGTESKKSGNFCAVIRHGERADHNFANASSVENEVDPPLTEKGLMQAK